MSREKQIEEMAKELQFDCEHRQEKDCFAMPCSKCRAEFLYNAGYRKQSENTVEVVRCKDCEYFEDDVIDDIHQYFCNKYNGMMSPTLDGYCSCGELKMKGGAE